MSAFFSFGVPARRDDNGLTEIGEEAKKKSQQYTHMQQWIKAFSVHLEYHFRFELRVFVGFVVRIFLLLFLHWIFCADCYSICEPTYRTIRISIENMMTSVLACRIHNLQNSMNFDGSLETACE